MTSQSLDQLATFAGGCFWCLEPAFAQLPGVKNIKVGYTGGNIDDPTYEQVSQGGTGHYEALQLTFNPLEVSYKRLLDTFWRQIDPTDAEGQFADRGDSYRTAIFYHTDKQKREAEASKQALADKNIFSQPIMTQILPATEFYPAEDYHQQYYLKHPNRYRLYSYGSGRKPFLEKTWGSDDSDKE